MKHNPTRRLKARSRVPTGIVRFDGIVGGGLPRGRTTLLTGRPGSGKTIFALQFLAHGARACNEPGIFVAFEETPDRLIANFEGLARKLLSDSGVTLADIHTAGGEVLMGTLRWEKESAARVGSEVAEVAGRLNLVRLDAEEAALEVRAKSVQTELLARQVEHTLLPRTTLSRKRGLSSGARRIRELRGADAADTEVGAGVK